MHLWSVIAMADTDKWRIQCPHCQAELVVDRKTGSILRSEAKSTKPNASLQEMVRRLDDRRQATTERVQQEQQALKDRSRLLEEKVKESMKRVDPDDVTPPLRPIDLD
jgi:predicted transcriptional regulator